MPEQWKLVCKVKDIPPGGARHVPRGLAWQELPGVDVVRADDDRIHALLDSSPDESGPRAYTVKVEDGKIYLDLLELNAPASRAEAALVRGKTGDSPLF